MEIATATRFAATYTGSIFLHFGYIIPRVTPQSNTCHIYLVHMRLEPRYVQLLCNLVGFRVNSVDIWVISKVCIKTVLPLISSDFSTQIS